MPRLARVVVPGVAHHVTQRGNNRQDVFFVDDDRVMYLKILAEQFRRHRVALLGWCLMTNHVHLIPRPPDDDPAALARVIGRTHWLYTQYVNRLHGRSGHLWQNRFFSCPLDRRHTLLATRYAEWNPIRAGLCRVARRYAWSSAAAHCDGRDPLGLLDLRRWRGLSRGLDWSKVLIAPLDDAEATRLRRCTRTGRPLASDSFTSKLEALLGRRLRPLPIGRPKQRRRESQISGNR